MEVSVVPLSRNSKPRQLGTVARCYGFERANQVLIPTLRILLRTYGYYKNFLFIVKGVFIYCNLIYLLILLLCFSHYLFIY